jgi:hypothetical protein
MLCLPIYIQLSLSLSASLGKSGDLVEIGFLIDQVAADMKSSPFDGFFSWLLLMILTVLLDCKPEVALEIALAAKGKE